MEDKEQGRGGKQMSKWIDLYFKKKKTDRKEIRMVDFSVRKGAEKNTKTTVVFIYLLIRLVFHRDTENEIKHYTDVV